MTRFRETDSFGFKGDTPGFYEFLCCHDDCITCTEGRVNVLIINVRLDHCPPRKLRGCPCLHDQILSRMSALLGGNL